MSVSQPVLAPTATAAHPGWRRAIAVIAVAAPLSELLSVAVGVEHTTDKNRQLDIIAGHIGSFTAMVLLEQLCYLLAAITAVAIALRLASARGGRLAAVGAVLTVVGATANAGGFGGAMPTLARQADRAAALHFVDNLGPIYGVMMALSILLDLGLVVVLVALWRSRRVAWPWLAAAAGGLVVSAIIGSGRVENVLVMLVVTVGFIGVARFLASPDEVTG